MTKETSNAQRLTSNIPSAPKNRAPRTGSSARNLFLFESNSPRRGIQRSKQTSTSNKQQTKAEMAGVFKERIETLMNNHTTYELLVHSKEKGRELLEIAVYVMCVLSAIVTIWQFASQTTRFSVDGLQGQLHSVPVMSQHKVEASFETRS
jgi:hypothetical protein